MHGTALQDSAPGSAWARHDLGRVRRGQGWPHRCRCGWLSRGLVILLPYRMVGTDRLEIAEQGLVKGMTPDRGTIPNDQDLAAGPRQGHIHAAHVGQEAYLTLKVRPHQRQYDRLLFAALEPVHAVDLKTGDLQLFPQEPYLG